MKTKKELQKRRAAIGKAISAYHTAILNNLKEGGKEYAVQGDDEDEEGQRISIHGRHDNLVDILVDKVRFKPHGSNGVVEIHISEEEYEEKDYWINADYIGADDIDYIYDYIVWDS